MRKWICVFLFTSNVVTSHKFYFHLTWRQYFLYLSVSRLCPAAIIALVKKMMKTIIFQMKMCGKDDFVPHKKVVKLFIPIND